MDLRIGIDAKTYHFGLSGQFCPPGLRLYRATFVTPTAWKSLLRWKQFNSAAINTFPSTAKRYEQD
jgi:hypothetical protein